MDASERMLADADLLDALELAVAAAPSPLHEPGDAGDSNGAKAPQDDHEEQEEDDEDNDMDDVISTSSSGGTPRDSDVGGSSSAETPVRTLSRTMQYQNRQRQELAYLKAKVRELEKTLRRIERENERRLAQTDNSVWQRVAHQQSVERQKSLAENAKLRESVEDQIKFAKNLERALRKRPHLSVFGDEESSRKRDPQRHPRLHGSACCIADLHDVTKREYNRLEDVVERTKILELPSNHRSLEVHVDDEVAGDASSGSRGQIRVQLLQKRRYPFAFADVGRVIWDFFTKASNIERIEGVTRDVEQDGDTLLATTTVAFRADNKPVLLSAKAAFRRHPDMDKFDVTWASEGECEPSDKAAQTFKLIETGW
ncbi:hypothetical protein ATCC90586_009805 [Pythium insidiosum]|nr:hypothetical protein ATCC90586_009805 [Pythium insidiosum]